MSPIVKKKAPRKKLAGKYVLLIFTVLCALLIFLTFRLKLPTDALPDALGRVIVPLQRGIASMADQLLDAADKRQTISELKEQNEELRRQIDELNLENALLMQDRYELTSLRELYALDAQYADYEKIGARIIASNSSNYFYSFLIDKGRDDGVLSGMNVIADAGLVGIVSEVGGNWARVDTIIADGSNVSAVVLHSQDHLIVSGDMALIEQGIISFSQLIDEDGAVGKGDRVVTSNISDKYLPGILIGSISSIEQDSNQLTRSGYISPVVDFTHLREVLVILQLKRGATEG